jgi:hypothetical protein
MLSAVFFIVMLSVTMQSVIMMSLMVPKAPQKKVL